MIPSQAPPRAQLIITLSHEGSLSVTGPINDMLLSYGLLEAAKDQIRAHIQGQLIQAVPAGAIVMAQ